jgi:purine nucleosidase
MSLAQVRKTPILLDCDTGVDDTMAILLACISPEIELVGIGTIWGNVDLELATQNTLNILAMCGRSDVPVARGATEPLNGVHQEFAYFVHGNDGQGNKGMKGKYGTAIALSAAEFIVDQCRKRPGEIELIPVGPLTNIALALQLEPELPKLVRGVTIMGGTALTPGNVSPVAEANIWHDPEAADQVFRAPWPITMVGLDVTMKTLLTEDHFAAMRKSGGIAQYMARIAEHYTTFNEERSFGKRLATMHDALAVGVAAGLVKAKLSPNVNVQVDTTDGPGRGQTICDLRGVYLDFPPQDEAHCHVPLELEPGFEDLFTARICNAGEPAVDIN